MEASTDEKQKVAYEQRSLDAKKEMSASCLGFATINYADGWAVEVKFSGSRLVPLLPVPPSLPFLVEDLEEARGSDECHVSNLPVSLTLVEVEAGVRLNAALPSASSEEVITEILTVLGLTSLQD